MGQHLQIVDRQACRRSSLELDRLLYNLGYMEPLFLPHQRSLALLPGRDSLGRVERALASHAVLLQMEGQSPPPASFGWPRNQVEKEILSP